MDKSLEIFGVRLHDMTQKEAMQRALDFPERGVAGTVLLLTMDMLLLAQEDSLMRENIRQMDLVLPAGPEVLEAAGITQARCIQHAYQRPFLDMVLRYLEKNSKGVVILAGEASQGRLVQELLGERYPAMGVLDTLILEQEASKEQVVNAINGTEVDCLLSVLPSPLQEAFIREMHPLIHAEMILGASGMLRQRVEEGRRIPRLKTFLTRLRFRHLAGQEERAE